MTTRELPTRDELVDYEYAVAGHAGTLADADGELFIKPATKTEVDFYESAAQQFPEFTEIMPLFMGTLALSDATEVTTASDDLAAIAAADPEAVEKLTSAAAQDANDGVTWKPNRDKRIKTNQAIVLENLTHGYKRPNILDAKLGVRLWADDAPMEKRQRFDIISAKTTHSDFGCRIAGMRVYQGSEDQAGLDEEGYRVCDRDYGRVAVNNDNFADAVRAFVFNKSAGITGELAKAVCRGFADELGRIEDVLSTHETRMYSASLLFVFEGEARALEEAIVRNNEMVEDLESKVPSTIRFDSGVVLDGDGEDDDDDDDDSLSLPRIMSLKLIDFAHATWVPGQGPDENTLTGVRSLRRIFEDLAA